MVAATKIKFFEEFNVVNVIIGYADVSLGLKTFSKWEAKQLGFSELLLAQIPSKILSGGDGKLVVSFF